MPIERSTPPPAREDQLVTAFRRGDLAAFEELYRSRFKDLCRYIATFIPPDDAADIVQDTYVAIWNMRDRLDVETDDALFFYLLRSSRNRALMWLRHNKIRDSHSAELAAITAEHQQAQASDSFDTVTQDLLEQIRRVIEGLPPRSQEVLTLRWYHGLGFEKIAELMGISYGYAHVLHNRAMSALRDRLKRSRS